ncbi:MAG: exostosin family protein [Candidatus Scalinduaceae bacterium]
MKFYLYPKTNSKCLTKWYDLVHKSLETHKQRVVDPKEATLLFPGFDTACETNWPEYGHADKAFIKGKLTDFSEAPGQLRKLEFWNGPKRHVLFDMNPFSNFTKMFEYENVILASSSLSNDNYRKGIDVSFPASPTTKIPAHFTRQEKYYLTFKGAISHPFRLNFLKFHNNDDIIIKLLDHNKSGHTRPWATGQENNREYLDLLSNTRFSLILRGDALFSYRLLEVMAFGTIPVIFTHGWVLPFSEILDYGSFSVIIDPEDWHNTISILNSYTDRQIETMRKKVKTVYDKHFSTIDKQTETLIYILDKLHNSEHFQFKEDLDNYPKEILAQYRMGLLFLKDNQFDEAINTFKLVINKDTQHIDALFNLAVAYERVGNTNQAKDCFLSTLKLDKYLIEAHLALSKIYISQNNIEECIKSCDELLKYLNLPRNIIINSMSDLGKLYINVGTTLLKQQKELLARFSFEVAALLDPDVLNKIETEAVTSGISP